MKKYKILTYILSLISLIIFTYFFINLIPIINKTSYIGIILTITIIIFILNYLYHTVKNKKLLQDAIFYNILIITIPIYISIFYYKITSVKTISNLNIEYCKTNFLILTVILITIILNTNILIKNQKKKNKN